MSETIFALATPPGRSGIAVIRISGPETGNTLETITRKPKPEPRVASLSRLYAADGEVLDTGLVLWFPGPASFTGEDMAELHVHGGPAVIADVIARLGALPGLAPAEAGEFTRRAFRNGKLDLTEVEGLADLIEAETAAQRRQAQRQLGGALHRTVEAWRSQLTRIQAHLEAAIDFSDEELPPGLTDTVEREIGDLIGEIDTTLADDRRGERLRRGLELAILGAPNAGKSSLLNALARRDAAIVAETAGTTRDVVEVQLDLGGYPVTAADTAGLRVLDAHADPIEREGMRRAQTRAAESDLKLVVVDGTDPEAPDQAIRALIDGDTLVVVSKADLAGSAIPAEIAGQAALAVSAVTGYGLDRLLDALERAVVARYGEGGEAAAITRERHRSALTDTRDALARARAAELPELAAEDLRLAGRALGRITGAVDVEDVLDVVFAEFCIGK